jgi:PqqD family protein of HPr-rel-A system
MEIFWKASPGSLRHWRQWEGSVVLFDEISGDTHALDPLAAELLVHLQDHRRTASDLTLHIAAALGVSANEAFRAGIAVALDRLANSRLIEREPPQGRPTTP